MTEEQIERYLELKKIEKDVATELDELKKMIIGLNQSEMEVGSHIVKVSTRTRMDLNKDNVAKLIEQAVDAGLIEKDNVEKDYVKMTEFKVVSVK